MSNPLKAVGKIFRKVVRVVKKIALPALAIGAAILTGGAALGLLPSVGSVLGAGGLGLSAGLTSVLTTAGQGALGGMLTSAISGKNVLKGASTGFLIGGAAGAVGQALRPAAAAVDVASASKAANSVVDAGIQANNATIGSQIAANAGMPAANVTATATRAAGLGSTMAASAPAPTLSAPTSAPASLTPASATPAPAGVVSGGQGIGSILSTPFKMLDGLDPYTRAGLIQGLGNGLMAGSQAKDQRKTEEARQQRIADNYGGGSYYSTERPTSYAPIQQRPRVVWKIDPITGDVIKDYA